MIRSMTGYGRGEKDINGRTFSVEMRSVNHRFAEVVIRLPKYYLALEDRVRKQIQERILRGRVDVFVNVASHGQSGKSIQVDKDLAMAYYNALEELRETIGIDGKLSVTDIARLPDVIVMEEVQEDLEAIWPNLTMAVEDALAQLVEMRTTEGERLQEDLFKRVDRLAEYTEVIAQRAPDMVLEHREKLLTRLKELEAEIQVDEGRLALEIALFADRSSITEELVRLRSHFHEFRNTVTLNESIGRKMDFLIQEFNREYNTIGSKSNDMHISAMVIKAKTEVEKIREQVQNIE